MIYKRGQRLKKVFITCIVIISTVFLYSCDLIAGLDDDKNGGGENQETISNMECTFSSAEGDVDSEIGAEGSLTVECDFQIEDLDVTSLTLGYEMDAFFGEPTRKAAFKWEGEGTIFDVKWGAAVIDEEGRQVTFDGNPVYVSWEEGTFKGPGEGFGTDATGSPSWDKTFLFFDESGPEFFEGIPEEAAKNIYTSDFTLSEMMILEINDEAL